MKIIHCADLHLDTRFLSHFDEKKARERRSELLQRFVELVEYANEQEIHHIMIAGDLFDPKVVHQQTLQFVKETIRRNSQITFYYLRGNHDESCDLKSEELSNLKTFSDRWTDYEIIMSSGKKIQISGIEIEEKTEADFYEELSVKDEDFSIVILHGLVQDYGREVRGGQIPLSILKEKGIQYLALGHIHEYQRGRLGTDGIYCYPGCLEGRGFDECGEHGFVLLEIEEDSLEWRDYFVPFAKRHLFELEVDISNCRSSLEMEERMQKVIDLADVQENDLLRLVLTGEVDVEVEKNLLYLKQKYQQKFDLFQLKDQSRFAIDYSEYEKEASLKGEFVRLLQANDKLGEEKKAAVIRAGIQALKGEDIEF